MSNRFRFLQTGDIHVGKGRSSWGEEVSLGRSARLFDELYAVAHEQDCHALLITGDVFDRKNVTNRERELVSRKLTQHSAAMPTYVISGNHDLTTKTNSNLDYLAEITENTAEIPNLHVSFAASESKWPIEIEGLPKGLFILGAPGILSEDQNWLENYVTTIPADDRLIFMGHGTVKGCARNDSLWRPKEHDDKGVSLARAGTSPEVVFWAWGDIHKRQKLPTLPDQANGYYAGSPIQMDFGEEPDRGATVVALGHSDSRGWHYKGRRYIRIDDRGFDPLIVVTKEDEIKSLPKNALIKLAKGLVLPSKRHQQVVATLKIVADHSTPEAAINASGGEGEEAQSVGLEAFDPLLANIKDLEREVLSGLKVSEAVYSEGCRVVAEAAERYRERTFVS